MEKEKNMSKRMAAQSKQDDARGKQAEVRSKQTEARSKRTETRNKRTEAAGKAEFRRRRLKYIAVLPTAVTLLNALCGFLSIVLASRGAGTFLPGAPLHKGGISFFAMAGYLVLLAMVADIFDGQVARWSGSASSFGGQLDSLSDVISFGAAPAFLLLKFMESRLGLGPVTGKFLLPLWKMLHAAPLAHLAGRWLLFTAIFYLLCTVIRLARFNVENDTDVSAHQYFAGLPSPAAAGLVVSLVIFQEDFLVVSRRLPDLYASLQVVFGWLLPLTALCCGFLMVSRIRYPHLANKLLRGKKNFFSVLLLLFAGLLAVWNIQLAMLLGFWGFAAAGVICALWRAARNAFFRRNNQAEGAA
jgi:CDP-diacylglycerol--serine O-phosphatidyltransferase